MMRDACTTNPHLAEPPPPPQGGHSLGVTVGARGQAGKQEPGDHIPPIVPRCPQSRGRGPDNGVTDNRDQQMVSPTPCPTSWCCSACQGSPGGRSRGPGPAASQAPPRPSVSPAPRISSQLGATGLWPHLIFLRRPGDAEVAAEHDRGVVSPREAGAFRHVLSAGQDMSAPVRLLGSLLLSLSAVPSTLGVWPSL